MPTNACSLAEKLNAPAGTQRCALRSPWKGLVCGSIAPMPSERWPEASEAWKPRPRWQHSLPLGCLVSAAKPALSPAWLPATIAAVTPSVIHASRKITRLAILGGHGNLPSTRASSSGRMGAEQGKNSAAASGSSLTRGGACSALPLPATTGHSRDPAIEECRLGETNLLIGARRGLEINCTARGLDSNDQRAAPPCLDRPGLTPGHGANAAAAQTTGTARHGELRQIALLGVEKGRRALVPGPVRAVRRPCVVAGCERAGSRLRRSAHGPRDPRRRSAA